MADYELQEFRHSAASRIAMKYECVDCGATPQGPCLHKKSGRPIKSVHERRVSKGYEDLRSLEVDFYIKVADGGFD